MIHFVNVDGKEFGDVVGSPNPYYETAVWRIEYILSYKEFPEGIKEGYVVLALTRLKGHE